MQTTIFLALALREVTRGIVPCLRSPGLVLRNVSGDARPAKSQGITLWRKARANFRFSTHAVALGDFADFNFDRPHRASGAAVAPWLETSLRLCAPASRIARDILAPLRSGGPMAQDISWLLFPASRMVRDILAPLRSCGPMARDISIFGLQSDTRRNAGNGELQYGTTVFLCF